MLAEVAEMAVFFNLAVDCDDDNSLAEELASSYHQMKIETTLFPLIECRAEHIQPGRYWNQPNKYHPGTATWHTVCVEPCGVALPSTQAGILSPQTLAEVRAALYAPLKRGVQFRSAWFGWEAQDALGESDWLELIEKINRTGELPNMSGLILAESIVSNPAAKSSLSVFCPGFLWIDRPYKV